MLGSGDLRPMQRGVASAILRVARHCPLTRAPAAAAAHVQHSRPLSTTAPWQQACCSSRFAVAHVRTLGLQLSAPMQQLHAPRGQQHPRTQQPAPRSAPACLPAAARRLSSSRSSSRPPLQLARAMPEHDLDAQLIARQAITSLSRFQQQAAGPGTANPPGPHSTSSGTEAPSGAASDAPDERAAPAPDSSSSAATGGLSWEEVQEHKRAAVQQAFLNDSLGFGFSAGGLVFPYYVGLVSALVQAGVMSRPTPLAGSSAGSLIAASFNAGLDMATVEASMIEFGEDCLKNGTRYRLGPLLKDFLHSVLPPYAHELCTGSTHVAVTRLLPFWRTQMVSHFESRDDLIAALLTSCHIPWYFDGRWMTKFRGHYCVDGGVMAFIPKVPDVDYTVKVMCFPSSHLSTLKDATASYKAAPMRRIHKLLDIDITMDTFEAWEHDLQQVLKWALLASAQETSSLLIEKGKRDANAWVEAMELAPLVAAKRAAQQQQQQQARAQQGGGQGTVVLPSGAAASESSSSSSSGSGGEATRGPSSSSDGSSSSSSSSSVAGAVGGGAGDAPSAVASDWSDDKGSQQRQQEAEAAHAKAADAEAAAAAEGRDPQHLEHAAAAAGADARAAKHAAQLRDAGVVQPPSKWHKAAAAAAVPAAAVAEGLGSLVSGGGGGGSESQAGGGNH